MNERIDEFKISIKKALSELGITARTRKSKDNTGVFIFEKKKFPCGAFFDIEGYNKLGYEYTKCCIAEVFDIEGYSDKLNQLLMKL